MGRIGFALFGLGNMGKKQSMILIGKLYALFFYFKINTGNELKEIFLSHINSVSVFLFYIGTFC